MPLDGKGSLETARRGCGGKWDQLLKGVVETSQEFEIGKSSEGGNLSI